ncbi:hypothetical protein AB0L05_06790 [Nonomuraea pusilla]|uniref:hypothetical protein n=1 Tax=Nonomuraea pusilla TaxID=46177 RepID=UPI0033315025
MGRQPVLALALAAVMALPACAPGGGTETGAKTPARTAPPRALAYVEGQGSLDVSLLRAAAFDFPVYESPERLAADEPVVAAGVIDGWQRGPVLDTGTGALDHHVVLRMRVTQPLKGVKGRASIPGGLVFIELTQGAVVSRRGVPARRWKPYWSVKDFAKALPSGTELLAFLSERPAHEFPVTDPGDPLPAGAKLMAAPPQGLVLEDPQRARQGDDGVTALVGGLERLSSGGAAWLAHEDLESLVRHLRAQGFSE